MTLEPVHDADHWKLALAGDGRAYAAIFTRHRDRVYRHIQWRINDKGEAEDLTAVVFLELWRKRATARLVEKSLLPWLLVTATNVCRNANRSKARYQQMLRNLPEVERTPPVVDQLETHEESLAVAAAISELSPIDQQLFALTVTDGISLDLASTQLGLSYGAAKTRVSRARRRIQAKLSSSANEILGEF